ncbi:hypothetical protein LTR95_016982 [Oleoguttula sp. CCFEE 5521]
MLSDFVDHNLANTAATFEQKRLEIAELCSHAARAQARIDSDTISIRELKVALRDAEAKAAPHQAKLSQLETELPVAGASLGEREGASATKPANLVSSDKEEIKEEDVFATRDED